ncbi:MAG: hypothetical protein ACJA1R_000548 [Flavobacteriales bacterium]
MQADGTFLETPCAPKGGPPYSIRVHNVGVIVVVRPKGGGFPMEDIVTVGPKYVPRQDRKTNVRLVPRAIVDLGAVSSLAKPALLERRYKPQRAGLSLLKELSGLPRWRGGGQHPR